ncbi:substrate-binding domain-containing protein [Comamonadaceae bacterium G21597-S1]|nr:substrate-binding domain-containing protein [Comamonadaceae bacterium G21597-S1]
MLTLGPAAQAFFYAPVKHVPAPVTAPAWARGGYGRTDRPAVSRVAQWNNGLLNLVDTERFRKPPPYVVGFANASLSNPWRVAMVGSLTAAARRQRDVAQLVVRDAHDDPELQVAQLQEMRAQGIDLLILSAAAGSDPRLDAAVSELATRGLPIIGIDRHCGGPEDMVSFVTASDLVIGRVSALWLAELLGGKGCVLMLCGRRDASPCQMRLQAAKEVFSLHPQIEIVGIEFTDWQAVQAQAAVSRMLTSGQVPDGVWSDSGLQSIGSLQAFAAAGFRKGAIPPHTGGDINIMYKTALQMRVPLCALDYPAAMGALAFQTALETLSGRQVPRRVETNLEVVVSRGHETTSVRADVLAEEKVRWDRENDFVHAAGWIPAAMRTRPRPAVP